MPRLASKLFVGHRLAWEGAEEVEEEEEEEHAKDGTNNELVNPAADNGVRRNGGCGCRCTAAVAAVAAIAVRSGHVVSANSVQAYCGADVGSNKPTNVELRCMPDHLINIVDPPVFVIVIVVVVVIVVVIIVIVVNNVVISYDTIFYSRSKIFQV